MEKHCRAKQAAAEKMRCACRLTKARTQSLIMLGLLFALPRQQWLRERASMLRYTYVTCLYSHIYFNLCLMMEF
jgi:hypothetical protein